LKLPGMEITTIQLLDGIERGRERTKRGFGSRRRHDRKKLARRVGEQRETRTNNASMRVYRTQRRITNEE